LESKRQFFANLFGENILKIITSVPGHPDYIKTIGYLSGRVDFHLGFEPTLSLVPFAYLQSKKLEANQG
jgi:hypothetical protein